MELVVGGDYNGPLQHQEVPDWAINTGRGIWIVLWLPPPRNCWLGFQFGRKQSWFCPLVRSLEMWALSSNG